MRFLAKHRFDVLSKVHVCADQIYEPLVAISLGIFVVIMVIFVINIKTTGSSTR